MRLSSSHTLDDLPLEVLHMILKSIRQSDQLGTLASFQRISKFYYNIVTPYLYTDIIIWDNRVVDLLDPRFLDNTNHAGETVLDRLKLTKKLSLIQSSDNHMALVKLKDIEEALESNEKGLWLPNVHSIRLVAHNLVDTNSYNLIVSLVGDLCIPKNMCMNFVDPAMIPCFEEKQLYPSSNSSDLHVVMHGGSFSGEDLSYEYSGNLNNFRISYSKLIRTTIHAVLKYLHDDINFFLNGRWKRPRSNRILRIIINGEDVADIKANIEDLHSSSEAFKEEYLDWRGANDTQKRKFYDDWNLDIEWVYGEQVKNEPLCQSCGLPV